MEIVDIYRISHLLGVVVGMGSAIMTDSIFIKSVIKDKKIQPDEFRFISLGSSIVWSGILIILISGILLFFTDVDKYLNSSKFLSKMIIVFILTINGYIFHRIHLPFLNKLIDIDLMNSEIFYKRSHLLFISGGISGVSWLFSLVLGYFSNLPYSVLMIMEFYLLVLLVGIVFSLLLRNIFFKYENN